MSAYPAPRVIHGEPIQWARLEKVFLLPLVQAGQDLHQIRGQSWPLAAMTGGVVLPVEIPHRVAPILERLHPSHNARGHDSNHGQSGNGPVTLSGPSDIGRSYHLPVEGSAGANSGVSSEERC